MSDLVRLTGAKGFRDLDWGGPEFFRGVGGRVALIEIGPNDAEARPIVAAVEYDPNAFVPVHHHDSDYVSVLIDGELTVGRTRHLPGSIRVVRATTAYGPIRVGPQGAKTIDTFAVGTGMAATWFGDDEETKAFAAEYERRIINHRTEPDAPDTRSPA